MVPSRNNTLIQRRKFVRNAIERRAPDPSEICALESEVEFGRFGIRSVSATVGINRSIFNYPIDWTWTV